MFLYSIEKDYFDTLTKTYLHEEELGDKSRYLFQGDGIAVLNAARKSREDEMYIVLTVTTCCNLICSYCFENGIRRHAMTDDTLSSVINKIEEYVCDNNIKKLHCTLFGGEPLLEEERLLLITSTLTEFCVANSVVLTISITTNGLITNKKTLKELHNNSVKYVQITFDGTREMNNSRRVARYSPINDSYTEILNNLMIFLDIFDFVNIKYNFDKQNFDEFDLFLGDLIDAVYDKRLLDKIVIVVEAIQGIFYSTYRYNYKNTDEQLAIAYVSIISKLIDRKIKYKSKIFNTPCMATATNSFMIDPDGNCFCCISNFKMNELYMGKFNDIDYCTSESARVKLNRLELMKNQCSGCDFVACCWGGCLYELLVNNVNCLKNLNCRRGFYEKAVELFYKEIYLKRGVKKID